MVYLRKLLFFKVLGRGGPTCSRGGPTFPGGSNCLAKELVICQGEFYTTCNPIPLDPRMTDMREH